MRIGVMLRSLDEKGGIGVYTHHLLEELLERDGRNHYVLLYRSAENLGRYADRPNVTERLVRGPAKPLWDQLGVPWACWREKVDVLFHPKFTVPFLAPCPAVMTVHGADWFIPEHARFYGRLDVAYIRAVMPAYFRRSAAVLSVSQITTDEFTRILGLEPGKVITTYLAPGKHFRKVDDREVLREVRERYGLPERFVLTLTKVGGEERKNFPGILAAYRRVHGRTPHALVVGGKGCEVFRETYRIPTEGWGADVHFPGWIDQADLPAVYTMADLYLYPSNLEAFPIPISEALACGAPVVTSKANGLEEIAGEAAILVDPEDPDDIARGMLVVLGDRERRDALSRAGLERSRRFSWERCARETLAVLEAVHRGDPPPGRSTGGVEVPAGAGAPDRTVV
jgi:glycosyltransferase involved in cell wall biosynthesis